MKTLARVAIVALIAGSAAFTACAATAALPDKPGGFPDRAADAVGAVVDVQWGFDSAVFTLVPDDGYEYFTGMTVDTFSVTVAASGAGAWSLADGDRVALWTGLCAESYPVQCQVSHMQVLP